MTLTVVDFQMLNSLFFWKKAKQNYLTYVGINPRNPMSTTFSPIDGSYFPSAVISCHSKLLFIESDKVMVTSRVSLPFMTKLLEKFPVTTHEFKFRGIGEVASIGFGTVVVPAGACPEEE
jgi:hypothetical protein